LKEVCVEVDEKVYEDIRRARALGYSLADIIRAGIEKLGIARLIEYSECGRLKPFEFRWPEGVEVFDEALCFKVRDDVYYIAYCFREAYGSNRRRIVIVRKPPRGKTLSAIVEFCGTDDWQATRQVASLIRRPDNRLARIEDVEKLAEYSILRGYIRDHGDVIRDGRKGYASLIVREDDYERMLYHAVKRYEMKKAKP
jgi:hypothetical protein